jgi:uncharacterized protein YidB (DUF937 family)
MGLFDQVLGAIADPNAAGDNNQLSGILDVVGQLTGGGQGNSDSVNSVISIVGNYARSALQEQRNTGGDVQGLVNQFGGTGANNEAVSAVFNNNQLQGLLSEVESKTGLDRGTIESMLPTVLPLVLNFLKTGSGGQGGNSVLNGFLDADGDGDVDLSDALRMAGQHLGR